MIDPRTTNIVGTRVRLVKCANPTDVQGRGVVRVVDYNHGTFTLLIEAVGAIGDGSWYSASDGELFQVSLSDETISVFIDDRRTGDASPIAHAVNRLATALQHLLGLVL